MSTGETAAIASVIGALVSGVAAIAALRQARGAREANEAAQAAVQRDVARQVTAVAQSVNTDFLRAEGAIKGIVAEQLSLMANTNTVSTHRIEMITTQLKERLAGVSEPIERARLHLRGSSALLKFSELDLSARLKTMMEDAATVLLVREDLDSQLNELRKSNAQLIEQRHRENRPAPFSKSS